MDIPYELVGMAMVLRDLHENIPYVNDEHERLVDFANFLRNINFEDEDEFITEIDTLVDTGFDPTEIITQYAPDYFINAISAAFAVEDYLDNGGDISQVVTDYLKAFGYKETDHNAGLPDILLANSQLSNTDKRKIVADTEIDLGDFNTVTFNSVEELYNEIADGQDLYCPETGTYMFVYNEAGAVCFYTISELDFYDLVEEAFEVGENYIGGLLGPGGSIVDVNLRTPDGEIIEYGDPEFEEFEYKEGYEIDYTNVYKALKPFVGVGMILANVRDFDFDNPYQPGTVGDYLFTHYNDLDWVETFFADGSKGWSCDPDTILHGSNNKKWVDAKIIREEPGDISWVKNSVRLYTDLVKGE